MGLVPTDPRPQEGPRRPWGSPLGAFWWPKALAFPRVSPVGAGLAAAARSPRPTGPCGAPMPRHANVQPGSLSLWVVLTIGQTVFISA
jgi:hypothetical protein